MGNLPPGPRSSIGSLVRYFRDPIGCMQPLIQKYGDPVLFPGKPPLVMTGDPAGIKAIYTADPDTFGPDPFARWSGTSFAAPQVAGAVARLAQEYDLTPRQALARLLSSGKPVPDFGQALSILPGL